MRDSSLKRFLVQNYFGLQALGSSVRAMWEQLCCNLLCSNNPRALHVARPLLRTFETKCELFEALVVLFFNSTVGAGSLAQRRGLVD